MYSVLRVGSQPVSWSESIVQSSSGLPGQPMLSTGVLTSGTSRSAVPPSPAPPHFPRPWHPQILKIIRGLYQSLEPEQIPQFHF